MGDIVGEAGPGTSARTREMPLEHLEAEICTLAGHLDAATCRWLLLVGDFDRRRGWAVDGLRSCAHWLMWRCGLNLVAAREKVRVAHCLDHLPATTAAFSRGEVSYAKVRALTRAASPDTEVELLSLAKTATAAQLEHLVRCYRKVRSMDEESGLARRAEESRYLRDWTDEDGCVVIKARLSPDQGAIVLAALEKVIDSQKHDSAESSSGDELVASLSQARADALVTMAETTLASGPKPCPPEWRHEVVLHVDLELLAGEDKLDKLANCHLEGGPALSVEAARRLACDGAIRTMTEAPNGTPMDLGRRSRVLSSALRKALQVRDKGRCRYPGCTNSWVDAHHVLPWSTGGRTDLSNLVLCCRGHHMLVHEGGFKLSYDPGADAVTVRRPDGTLVPATPDPPNLDGSLEALDDELGLDIGPDTCGSLWGGEPLDYGLAIDGWLSLERERGDLAPTGT
ncbi:MAG: DUF222 domain-containing protein [Acidimicrobiales bacterium]